MTEAIRVYVVDDHPVVREGLVSGLNRQDGVAVVGSAGTAEDALRELAGLPADVAVVDYSLPGMDGAQLCQRVARSAGGPACLVLTGSDSRAAIERSFEAGAQGYLLKDASMSVITIAVRALARGESYVDPRIETLRAGDRDAGRAQLTERELRVLRLIAEGRSNSEIAAELHVSTGSAKNYVSRLLVKLDVTRRAEAVAKAAERGLL